MKGLMIRSYLNRWRWSGLWDISRKNILDIDSQQIGSVTYGAGVGAELVGDKVSEVGEVGEVGRMKSRS